MEKEENEESKHCLKNIFHILEEFIAAGNTELKPSSANLGVNMFKIEGFQVPQPLGRGKTVRNPHVFQLLINLFNKVIIK